MSPSRTNEVEDVVSTGSSGSGRVWSSTFEVPVYHLLSGKFSPVFCFLNVMYFLKIGRMESTCYHFFLDNYPLLYFFYPIFSLSPSFSTSTPSLSLSETSSFGRNDVVVRVPTSLWHSVLCDSIIKSNFFSQSVCLSSVLKRSLVREGQEGGKGSKLHSPRPHSPPVVLPFIPRVSLEIDGPSGVVTTITRELLELSSPPVIVFFVLGHWPDSNTVL